LLFLFITTILNYLLTFLFSVYLDSISNTKIIMISKYLVNITLSANGSNRKLFELITGWIFSPLPWCINVRCVVHLEFFSCCENRKCTRNIARLACNYSKRLSLINGRILFFSSDGNAMIYYFPNSIFSPNFLN
jgi:hypothetical protein